MGMCKKLIQNFRVLLLCVVSLVVSHSLCLAEDPGLRNDTAVKEVTSQKSKPRQIAVFKNEENAKRLVKKLYMERKRAFYKRMKSGGQNTVFAVFVKEAGTKSSADAGTALETGIAAGGMERAAVKTAVAGPAVGAAPVPDKSTETGSAQAVNPAEAISPSLVMVPVKVDFRDYVNKVLEANPLVKINEQDYKQTQTRFLRELEAYGINLAVNGYTTAYYDNSGKLGAQVSLDALKILYDGGKKQILGREFEIIKDLSKANLLTNYDTALLTAALYYSEFYYQQQILDFLKEQFERQRSFIQKIESSYQKGVNFTIYDSLTARSDELNLENGLMQQKSNLLKAETTFRQYGHAYAENFIELAPLDIRFPADLDELQKYAIVHNNSITAARLSDDLQRYRISERKAEGGLRVSGESSVRFQAGSTNFTGGTNFSAGVGLRFSLPLLDGGVRRTEILSEQVESLKQRLSLEKTTEDVIKKINDVYSDYKTFGQTQEILEQQLRINEERLRISMERLQKGLEDYRAVRESWTDLIATKVTLIQQSTISQKFLIDLIILSGKRLFD